MNLSAVTEVSHSIIVTQLHSTKLTTTMPRAEGSFLTFFFFFFYHCKLMDRSRNAEMGCQQNEIKGPAAPAVVLPGLPEAMPRRERLQDARRL